MNDVSRGRHAIGCPPRAYDRAVSDRPDRDELCRAGLITLTEGNEVDYFQVVGEILADRKGFDIRKIGFDLWKPACLCRR